MAVSLVKAQTTDLKFSVRLSQWGVLNLGVGFRNHALGDLCKLLVNCQPFM